MAVQTFRELLRRRPFQPFRLVIFPFVALVLLSVACEGDHARNSVADHAPPANENTAPLPKSWEEMRTVVNQLPDADGRALVLYVKGKFAINFRETVAHNIPKGGSDQLWALKVFSRG